VGARWGRVAGRSGRRSVVVILYVSEDLCPGPSPVRPGHAPSAWTRGGPTGTEHRGTASDSESRGIRQGGTAEHPNPQPGWPRRGAPGASAKPAPRSRGARRWSAPRHASARVGCASVCGKGSSERRPRPAPAGFRPAGRPCRPGRRVAESAGSGPGKPRGGAITLR
jgi:hypothetical protein